MLHGIIAALFAAAIFLGTMPNAARAARSDPPPHGIEPVIRVIEHLANAYPMSTATLGVSIVDGATGRMLYERDAGKEFAPASNFKLLVAAAALAYLGPGYRYQTQLLTRGPIADGVLNGDLILVGGGDPVLSRSDLASAAKAAAATGITRVTGTVLADDTFFDEQRYGGGWAWDDFPYYYQAPIQALSIDEGLAKVTVMPGASVGAPVAADVEPNHGVMTVVSTAATSKTGGTNDIDCFRSPCHTQIVVVGHYPLGSKKFTFGCAVEDSAAYAVGTLTQLLIDEGISVSGAATGPTMPNGALDIEDPKPAPATVERYGAGAAALWTHESPTVAQLIARMMPPSDNFIADHLFKTLPVAALHQRGTFDGGAAVERRFIASLGLDPRTIDNGDGSGLSQGDRITPHDFTTLLDWETRSSTGGAFIHALPVAGVNGTVRRRLHGSDAAGRVRVKTGYIWHVSTFSGYAQTRHHGLVVFSVMFNDADGSLRPFLDAEDKIVEALVDCP